MPQFLWIPFKQFLVLFNEGLEDIGFDQVFFIDPVTGVVQDWIYDLAADGYEVHAVQVCMQIDSHRSSSTMCR